MAQNVAYRTYKDSIKVRRCNLFYILYYAFCPDWSWPDLSEFEDVVPDEEFENVLDMFSGVMESHLAKLLKQGLYREYLDRTEDLPTIRGKIDMVGTIRNKIAHRQLISCEYDELSENTLSNRIIKTAVNFLLRKGRMKPEREDSLRQEIRYFSNVDEIRDLTSIPWSRLHFHRNNKDYRILIFVSRLILKELLLTAEDGDYELESFVSERRMNTLYEKFILGYYQTKFSQLDAAVRYIYWAGAEERRGGFLPIMKTDIMLSYRDEKQDRDSILIIDAKWYGDILLKKKKKKEEKEKTTQKDQNDRNEEERGYTDDEEKVGRLRSAHLYQIFAYVKNKEAELIKKEENKNAELSAEKLLSVRESRRVQGMLLYAATKEKFPHDVAYNMGGNKISARTLDLSQEFSGVEAQLDKIANDFISSEAKQQG